MPRLLGMYDPSVPIDLLVNYHLRRIMNSDTILGIIFIGLFGFAIIEYKSAQDWCNNHDDGHLFKNSKCDCDVYLAYMQAIIALRISIGASFLVCASLLSMLIQTYRRSGCQWWLCTTMLNIFIVILCAVETILLLLYHSSIFYVIIFLGVVFTNISKTLVVHRIGRRVITENSTPELPQMMAAPHSTAIVTAVPIDQEQPPLTADAVLVSK